MFTILKSNLGKRILLLVSVSIVLMLVAFVVSGWLAISQTSARVLQERQALAQSTGKYLDYILAENLERLENFRFAPGINLDDSNLEPEKAALHDIYLNSIFDEGVFLTDISGMVLWTEPQRSADIGTNFNTYAPVAQSLKTGRTAISLVTSTRPEGDRFIQFVVPVRSPEGRTVGVVGGQVNPLGKFLRDVTHLADIGAGSYLDIVDTQGNIIASSSPARLSGNSGGTASEVIVLAPLAYAPWSIAIRQAEAQINAPVREMEMRLLIFGIISMFIVFLLSWGMARSIIKPLAQLNEAAQNIAQGDISRPIPQTSDDEIGQLSRSFDTMRVNLKKSLEEIQMWNRALELKVQARTRELEDSYREIETKETARRELIRRLFSVQEEERKRIARELHDETSQSLNGLVMRLEAAQAMPAKTSPVFQNLLEDIKGLAVRTVDSVHKVIFDLRPAVLDDLGLLSAIRWYAQHRLEEHHIKARIEVTGEEKKLPAAVENAVFRVAQETVTNIIRHAEAQNVLLSVEFTDLALNIEVEDDGKGFVDTPYDAQIDKTCGLGLMGMKERVALLGGDLRIQSQPGAGTHIYIYIPLTE